MEINTNFGTILGLTIFVLIFIFIRWIKNQTKKCEVKPKKKKKK